MIKKVGKEIIHQPPGLSCKFCADFSSRFSKNPCIFKFENRFFSIFHTSCADFSRNPPIFGISEKVVEKSAHLTKNRLSVNVIFSHACEPCENIFQKLFKKGFTFEGNYHRIVVGGSRSIAHQKSQNTGEGTNRLS